MQFSISNIQRECDTESRLRSAHMHCNNEPSNGRSASSLVAYFIDFISFLEFGNGIHSHVPQTSAKWITQFRNINVVD